MVDRWDSKAGGRLKLGIEVATVGSKVWIWGMAERERVVYYLSEAKKFIEASYAEFERWEREGGDILIRDVAEKAWNAVLQATNALLIGRGFPEEEIRSHRDRRLALVTLQSKDPKVKAEGLRDRFSAREHNLHEMCFYEGEYLPEGIVEDLLKAKAYVEDVIKILEATSR